MTPGKIYMDNCVTSPLDPEVLQAMLPYFSEKFWMPGTFISTGETTNNALDEFRQIIAKTLNADNINIIKKISSHTSFITENVQKMIDARKVANKVDDQRQKAMLYHDTVAPYMESIRYHIDKLELIVEDEMWTLPKYRELLFIR